MGEQGQQEPLPIPKPLPCPGGIPSVHQATDSVMEVTWRGTPLNHHPQSGPALASVQ